MVSVVKFEPTHMEELMKLKISPLFKASMNKERMEIIAAKPHNFTALSDKGEVLACIGLSIYWADRAEAWAIFNPDCKKYFLGIHHAVKRFLANSPVKRVEAAVDVNFKEGHRWAKSLGFKLEAEHMTSFWPDGTACSLYSKVRA